MPKVQSSQKYRTQKALGGIHGRGGTDMRIGIQHALNRQHRPDVIVLLTDGETPYPEAKLPVSLIVVIVGEPGRLVSDTAVGEDGRGTDRAGA